MPTKKKTTLVMPPDERIRHYKLDQWYFSEDRDTSLAQSVWSNNTAFPLLCIGLWDLLFRKCENIPVEILHWRDGWMKLASGELKLADVKFRKCTSA